jgi:transcriptional regulator with XRE-family HTH domain
MERTQLVQIVSENIQLVMAEKDLNAAEVARRAELNPTAVYDILKGKIRSPRIDTIEKIAGAMHVSPLSLMRPRSDDEVRQGLLEAFDRMPAEEKKRLALTARAWLQAGEPV